MRVVICGGGAIGACIAYFLSRRGIDVTVVERTGVACAASGKAGGFLALDWCGGSPLDALARRSFALHARLPGEIEGDWGYRRHDRLCGLPRSRWARRRGGTALDWVSDHVAITPRLGTPQTTAIVHPRIVHQGRHAGGATRRRHAAARAGDRRRPPRRRNDVRASRSTASAIEADAVVIAMGPWSLLAAAWLPLPPVFGRTSPSLVFDTGTDVPADALFLDCHEDDGPVRDARSVSARQRQHPCHRLLQRRSAAAGPGRRHAGSRRAAAPGGDLPAHLARVRQGEDHRPPGLRAPGDAGFHAADRQGAGASTAPMSRPATTSGASSTRRRRARRWRS